MKRLFGLLLLLLSSTLLFAIPAKRTPTTVAQPDGTTITVIAVGDERYHFTETLDGYVVLQGTDRFWYYATLDGEGRYTATPVRVRGTGLQASDVAAFNIAKHLRESSTIRREQLRVHPMVVRGNIEFRPSTGVHLSSVKATTRRVLVLCVQYPDLAATQTAASFQSMINDDNWHSGVGGLSKYYEDASYGALSVQADYQNWITAANGYLYYGKSNANYAAHVQELVAQCVDAAEANGVDFSQYDNDGDGEVDGLFMIHAGKGAEEGGQTNYIWSHAGGLGSSYTRTYDGVSIASYITMPELLGTSHTDIGVFCHEYGHQLGLPDTYDVDYETNGESSGLGDFCLMAGGSWGAAGDPWRPVMMSAYCRSLLGYVSPTEVTTSGPISVPQVETNPTAYKVWLDEHRTDEYVLIENREKTGFDLNLPNAGLAMYHIDRNLADIWPASNSINVRNSHLGIKLYEADGLEELANGTSGGDDGDQYPGSTGNTALTGTSTPNSHLWDGTPSGVEITNISVPGATMTADVTVPTYHGSSIQFFRQTSSYGVGTTANSAYGMVKVIPTQSGKVMGVRVYSYANRWTNVTAEVFSTLSGSTLSGSLGASVSTASHAYDEFLALNFSPGIDVSAGVPVYVRLKFDRSSGGYVVPIDMTAPITGKSYYSSNGTTFSVLASYDIVARVVLRDGSGLPVQLSRFSAEPGESGVTLRWSTASEVDNYGFQLEKDTIGTTPVFRTVANGFVPGHGTTVEPQEYQVVDASARQGRWVYRLKQIDLSGSVHYSDPIEVQVSTTGVEGEPAIPAAYALEQNYPNPFNPVTQITFALPVNGDVRLAVYDMLGREVATLVNGTMQAGYHMVAFDASRLASGAYLYRLNAGTFTMTRRMTVVK